MAGSLEAIIDVLATCPDKSIKLNVLEAGVGAVTETEVEFARTFDGLIYTFNVGIDPKARHALEDTSNSKQNADNQSETQQQSSKQNSFVREYNIIYELIDDLKEELQKRIPNSFVDEKLGKSYLLVMLLLGFLLFLLFFRVSNCCR